MSLILTETHYHHLGSISIAMHAELKQLEQGDRGGNDWLVAYSSGLRRAGQLHEMSPVCFATTCQHRRGRDWPTILLTYFPDSLVRFEAAAPASCRHDGGLAGGLLLQATKSQHWTSHTLYSITLLRRSYCVTFLKNLTSILTFCKFLQYAL